MNEISRMEIEQKIKAAYKDAKEWCRCDWGHYYKMMIDLSDARIWIDCFADCNSYKKYNSQSITALEYTPGYASDTEQGYIDDAITKLIEAGWIITD